jgi:hypothetical protein
LGAAAAAPRACAGGAALGGLREQRLQARGERLLAARRGADDDDAGEHASNIARMVRARARVAR